MKQWVPFKITYDGPTVTGEIVTTTAGTWSLAPSNSASVGRVLQNGTASVPITPTALTVSSGSAGYTLQNFTGGLTVDSSTGYTATGGATTPFNASLPTTTLGNVSGTFDLADSVSGTATGVSGYLVSGDVVQSRTASVTTGAIALGRKLVGTSGTGTIGLGTVLGSATDSSDTYNTHAQFSITGSTVQMTGTTGSGNLTWNSGTLSTLGSVGAAIPITATSLENPSLGDTPTVTGTASWSATVVQSRTADITSSAIALGRVIKGATASGIISLGTVLGGAPNSSDTYNTDAQYSIAGSTLQMTGSTGSGSLSWNGGTLNTLGAQGAPIPITATSLENPSLGDTPTVTGTASWSANVVANRSVTASTAALGRVIVGQTGSGSTTLTTQDPATAT